MIIDETFMWLYIACRIGKAFITLGWLSIVISIILAIAKIEIDSREVDTHRVLSKSLCVALVLTVVSFPIGAITPSSDECKAYAAYAIGKDVATSDEAKRLFNAALKYIEGESTPTPQP